jgi:hypothetical protein
MPANTTFTAGAVLTAQQMNNLPWGVVDATAGGTSGRGFVRSTTNFTMTTTAADVTGMTVTFNALAGRIYRATFTAEGNNVATAQNVKIDVTDGSNNVYSSIRSYMISTGQVGLCCVAVLTGLTGSQILKVRAAIATANAAILTGNQGIHFVVEDIGPAS